MGLSRNAEEITSVIQEQIKNYRADLEVSDVGRVLEVGDGIARIYGLENAMAGELLDFGNDVFGQVFNLEENSIGAVILGDYKKITEGSKVESTGRLLDIPVGDAVLGRVITPLGHPVDGKGPIKSNMKRPVEMMAPGIAARQPVTQPLQTGIKSIDSMTPVGRGQRELIIGDRKTGKTQIAIDAIINQKEENVICVYVAIGQKESTIATVVEALRANGALDYTVVIKASASDPAPLQYISAYAGCTVAESLIYKHGRDTLVVYDDLTKQASAYRELSLLLRRPPGREAYPGDVFYLHSRLLERSVKMADEFILVKKGSDPKTTREGVDGKVYMRERKDAEKALEAHKDKANLEVILKYGSGGSLTALPVIETQEGDVSAYIPTNVISITDGQIYLVPDLFNAGIRPAVDVGISVSRVGGAAQVKGMKKFAGSLRLDLAAFRELEAFAQLGTELDTSSQAQLDRGYRMVELLKQGIYEPLNVADQIILLFAGTKGYIDGTAVAHVRKYCSDLTAFIRDQEPEIRDAIKNNGDISEATEKTLRAKLENFAKDFNRDHGVKKD